MNVEQMVEALTWEKRMKAKTKTSELTGAALDWAVAKCEGYTELHKIEGRMPHEPQLGIWPPRKEYGAVDLWELSFSTDWAQGGPIIEREKISVLRGNDLYFPKGNEKGEFYEPLWIATRTEGPLFEAWGTTPLIAAMRCYAASKLGDEVEVPNELMEV